MIAVSRALRPLALIAGLCCGVALPATGDPDEAWLLRTELPPGLRPLLVLIVDTSTAMAAPVMTREAYDPAIDYAPRVPAELRCASGLAYWRRGPGPAPDCGRITGLEILPADPTGGLPCSAAADALAVAGFDVVACSAEAAAEFDDNSAPPADVYIFYSGNYLNWLQSSAATVERPLAEAITQALAAALPAAGELDVAVIRPTDAGDGSAGAFVALAPLPATAAAVPLRAITADAGVAGSAWLAAALYETAAWLSGSAVRFGTDPRTDPGALDPAAGDQYRTPFTQACRPASIAVLTAGDPAPDAGSSLAANALPGFADLTGGCDADCLPALSAWLARADLLPPLPGHQHAALHWLAPATAAGSIVEAASTAGATLADPADPLALVNLLARSLRHDAAVPAAPQLSAAGLVPAAGGGHAATVVYGVMAPRERERWGGNLLLYGFRPAESALAGPVVVDAAGEPVLDAISGLPLRGSRSLWSDTSDDDLLAGGAAGRLPAAAARRLFSDLTPEALTAPANRLAPDNAVLDRGTFGLGAHDSETPAELVAWLAAERRLGDPGVQAPLVVRGPDEDALVLAATQDGLLQALDLATGSERWAFLPRQLLPRLAALRRDEAAVARSHGLDGALVLHERDADGNGRIDDDAGEHRWLLFGLGRGGSGYYALDLALLDEPRLLWFFDPAGGAAESWADPVLTRLAIAGSGQSAGDWVVLLAGGYDRRFDAQAVATTSAGSRLSLLDAANGRLLWQAGGGDDDAATLRIPGFEASLPSAPRALDLDGDGRLDRLYQIDLTGSLWRFDFTNGAAAGELARATRIARLGDGSQRFFATPDASVVRLDGALELALAVGSGWLSRPRDATLVDRLYVLFDREPTASARTLTETDLQDMTAAETGLPPGSPGWFLRLDRQGSGEKAIGPTLTFDHRLWLRTYQPLPQPADAPCGPPAAIRRLYAFELRTGLPARRGGRDFEEPLELAGSGLPAALRFAIPSTREAAPSSGRLQPFGIAGSEVFDAAWSNLPVRTSWRRLRPPADSR